MLIAGTVATLLGLLAIYYLPGVVVRLWVEMKARNRLKTDPFLALTYDDGPSEVLTPKVLDLLDEFTVKATFFVIGDQAERHTQVLDQIRSRGHVVGWHSKAHLNAWKSLPLSAMCDVLNVPSVLKNNGSKPILFRPPYGKATLFTLMAILFNKQSFVPWTFVSGDTHGRLPELNEALGAVERRNGGIILMHDNDRPPARSLQSEEFVLEFTRGLLAMAKLKGWPVVVLGEERR